MGAGGAAGLTYVASRWPPQPGSRAGAPPGPRRCRTPQPPRAPGARSTSAGASGRPRGARGRRAGPCTDNHRQRHEDTGLPNLRPPGGTRGLSDRHASRCPQDRGSPPAHGEAPSWRSRGSSVYRLCQRTQETRRTTAPELKGHTPAAAWWLSGQTPSAPRLLAGSPQCGHRGSRIASPGSTLTSLLHSQAQRSPADKATPCRG